MTGIDPPSWAHSCLYCTTLTYDDALCGTRLPVATDGAGRVYIPYCNGTVNVFDGLSHALLHNFSVSQAGYNGVPEMEVLVPGPSDTVYYMSSVTSGIVQQHIVTGQILATLDVDGSILSGLAYDARNQTVWTTDVSLGGSSAVYQLAADGRLLTNFTVPSPDSGSAFCGSVAVDTTNDRLVASCYTKQSVLLWLDRAGNLLDSFPLPKHAANALAVSSDCSRLYAPIGDDNSVYILDQSRV